jgi:hypothetical protein
MQGVADMWMSTTAGGIELNTLNAGHPTGVTNGQINANAQSSINLTAITDSTLTASRWLTTSNVGSLTYTSAATATFNCVTNFVVNTGASPTQRLTIEADGSWNIGGSNGTTGLVPVSAGSAAPPAWGQLPTAGIADAAVTLAKQASLAQSTIIGRAEGAGTGVPQALTPTQVIAIVDGESPTWTSSHRFDSFIQFGTSTGLPASGDIRKAGAMTLSSGSQVSIAAVTDVDITASDDIFLTATDVIGLTAATVTVSSTNGVQFGSATGMPSTGDIRKGSGVDLSIQSGKTLDIDCVDLDFDASNVAVISAGSQLILTAGGTVDINSPHRLNNTTSLTAVQTSSSATVNNLALTSNVVRMAGAGGAWSLTGMVPNEDGQMVLIVNVAAFSGIIQGEDAGSTAANRFAGIDRAMVTGQVVVAWYDGTLDRWCIT